MKLYFDTVINGGNGLPVVGATVSFLIDDVAQTTYATAEGGGGATYTTTDANGLYQRYVPDGTYTIRQSYTFAARPTPSILIMSGFTMTASKRILSTVR